MISLSEHIFKTYDIRGIYPTELNELIAEHVGKAFGTILINKGLKSVVIGSDNRVSSPAILASLINGLTSTGCTVTNIGITLSPVIYFLSCTENFDAGITVTASHNPKDYNGIKFNFKNAVSFYGDEIQLLKEVIKSQDYVVGHGTVIYDSVALVSKYIDYIKHHTHLQSKLKVVVNCGNGAACDIVNSIFKSLNCEFIPLHCEMNSAFPNGVPDPENRKFLHMLSQEVLRQHADIGLGIDTDGDRLGVVDENGASYETDKLLLLLAKDVFLNPVNKNHEVVYDVKCSRIVESEIKKLGGIPRMIRTGHVFFKEAIHSGTILGGEYSGHTYIKDGYFGFDDGVYGVCRILEILSKSNQKISTLMQEFPKRAHTSEVKVACSDDVKFNLIVKIADIAKERYLDCITIDGVRANVSETGWFLIRASNTSPNLTIRVEGVDSAEVGRIIKDLSNILQSSGGLDISTLLNAEVFIS